MYKLNKIYKPPSEEYFSSFFTQMCLNFFLLFFSTNSCQYLEIPLVLPSQGSLWEKQKNGLQSEISTFSAYFSRMFWFFNLAGILLSNLISILFLLNTKNSKWTE